MNKLSLFTASAVTLLSSAAMAGSPVLPAEALPPTHVIHQLVGDGLDLRKLEAKSGTYVAQIGTGAGEVVTVGIDPVSVDVTDRFSSVSAKRDTALPPKVNAAEAIMAVAYEGYWDVSKVEYKSGAWRVQARDDAGRTGNWTVDGASGQAFAERDLAFY